MPKYHIEWIDHEARSAYVTAESESAARQAWIDGDFDYEEDSYTETGSEPVFTLVRPDTTVHKIDEELSALVGGEPYPLTLSAIGGYTCLRGDVGEELIATNPRFEGAPVLMLDEDAMRKVRELIDTILGDR